MRYLYAAAAGATLALAITGLESIEQNHPNLAKAIAIGYVAVFTIAIIHYQIKARKAK